MQALLGSLLPLRASNEDLDPCRGHLLDLRPLQERVSSRRTVLCASLCMMVIHEQATKLIKFRFFRAF